MKLRIGKDGMRDECRTFEPEYITNGLERLVEEIGRSFKTRSAYESADPLQVIKIGPLHSWRLKLAEMLHASIWEGQLSRYSKSTQLLMIRESTIPLWEEFDTGINRLLRGTPQLYRHAVSGMQHFHDYAGSWSREHSWHAGGQRHIVRASETNWKYRGGLPLAPSVDLRADKAAHYYARWTELEIGEQFSLAHIKDVSPREWFRMAERWNVLTDRNFEVASQGNVTIHVERVKDLIPGTCVIRSTRPRRAHYHPETRTVTRDAPSGDQG